MTNADVQTGCSVMTNLDVQTGCSVVILILISRLGVVL